MSKHNEEGKPKLSNEYRENLDKQAEAERDPVEVEAEKVGEDVMMQRDQHAIMRSLQVTKMVAAMDRAHTKAAIRVYDEFIDELAELPVSEAVRDIGLGIAKQVAQLGKSVEGSQLTRASQVMLAALQTVSLLAPADLNQADDEKLEETVGDDGDDSLDDEPTNDDTI